MMRYDLLLYPRIGTVSLRKPYNGLITQGNAEIAVMLATCAESFSERPRPDSDRSLWWEAFCQYV